MVCGIQPLRLVGLVEVRSMDESCIKYLNFKELQDFGVLDGARFPGSTETCCCLALPLLGGMR